LKRNSPKVNTLKYMERLTLVVFHISVVRAKVLSGPKYGYMPNIRTPMTYNVYQLRIVETFKGREHVQKNLLIPDESFDLANLYAPLSRMSSAVHLNKNSEYLLIGKVLEGNLYISFCDWRQKWANVTWVQLEGVRTQYSKGCQCSIGFSFCFTNNCPARGCDRFPDPDFDCRAKYDRCEINIDGKSCSWLSKRRSGNFQRCAVISSFSP